MIETNQEMLNHIINGDMHKLRKMLKACNNKKVITLQANVLIRTAASVGNLPAVELLIMKGANCRAVHDSALRLACVNGHSKVVRYLIKQGCDVNALSAWGFRLAARNGYIAVVRLLTRAGVDLARFGNDALDQAKKAGDDIMYKYLNNKMRSYK